jgi:hypothetical protein
LSPPILGGKIGPMNFDFDRPAERDLPIIISRMAVGTWHHYGWVGNTFLEVQRTGWGFSLSASRTDGVALWYAGVRRSGMEYRINDHGAVGGSEISEDHLPGLITALTFALNRLHRGVSVIARDALNESAGV